MNSSSVVEPDSAAALDALFQGLPFGLMIFDRDLRYLRVNDALLTMNGGTLEERRGRTVREVHPDLADGVEAALREVLDTGRPIVGERLEGELRYRPGEPRVWRMSYVPIEGADGSRCGVGAIAEDVTEAELHEEEERKDHQRLELLSRATAEVISALEPGAKLQALARAVVPAIADTCAVFLLTAEARRSGGDDGQVTASRVAVAGPSGLAAGRGDGGVDIRFPGDDPVTQAVHNRAPALLHVSPGQMPEWSHALRPRQWGPPHQAHQPHTMVGVPVIAAHEVVAVVVFVACGERPTYSGDDLRTMAQLAVRANAAVEHALRLRQSQEIAATLQRSMLPSADASSVDGLEVCARYLPGADEAEVGGDWFDIIRPPCGGVGLVIGDVMGRGVHAAAVMGQVRTAVRAYSKLGLSPAKLLDAMDELMVDVGESGIATCIYGVLDPRTHELRFANAGHVPPLVALASGVTHSLDSDQGPPLGAGVGGYQEHVWSMPEEAVLALYTDGLVESPRHDLDVGINALASVLDGDSTTLEGLCDVAIETMAHLAGEDDDTALLLVRRRSQPVG